MPNVHALVANITGQHRLEGSSDAGRCMDCGVTVWHRKPSRHDARPQRWLEWWAPDGRTWSSFPENRGWETYPDGRAPLCPPQEVEAQCPWEETARAYGGVWGEVQVETALRTWCERHQSTVADCPKPGNICPGAPAHEDGEKEGPGPCTGREDTCQCMCPACCGDTPDMYGYDGDY